MMTRRNIISHRCSAILRVFRFGLLQDGDLRSASSQSVWKSISGYFQFADHAGVITWVAQIEMPRCCHSPSDLTTVSVSLRDCAASRFLGWKEIFSHAPSS